MRRASKNHAATAWYAVGGLLVLGLAFLVAREIPSMRRELRLMRM